MGFLAFYQSIAPPWLQRPVALRLLTALSELHDEATQQAKEAVEARFPSRAPDGALPYIGLDRDLEQGVGESTTNYRARLANAWELWSRAGTLRGLATALRTLGIDARCDDWVTWTPQGKWGDEGTIWIVPGRQWPQQARGWASAWVVFDLYRHAGGLTSRRRGADPTFRRGPSGTNREARGLRVPAVFIERIRTTVAKWKPAHACMEGLLCILSDGHWCDVRGLGIRGQTPGTRGARVIHVPL